MKQRDRVSLRIKTIRKRRRLTQDQLAEKIGRTGDAVSQLERGLSLPSFETLERLAQALDVPIRDFFDSDRTEGGSAQRQKLLAEVIDLAGRMTEKDLQVAVQVLEAVTSGKTRSKGKA